MQVDDVIGRAMHAYEFEGTNATIELWIDGELDGTMEASYFFRTPEAMNALERKALELAQGRVLDVGAGAGCHALELQSIGLKVDCVEHSAYACRVMEHRGVQRVFQSDVQSFKGGPYDTILLLMNGFGIAQTEDGVFDLLKHLKGLLAPGGCILADSTDISYFKQSAPESKPGYYGEVLFNVRSSIGEEEFAWIYPDDILLEVLCEELELTFEVIEHGENGSFLCKISSR